MTANPTGPRFNPGDAVPCPPASRPAGAISAPRSTSAARPARSSGSAAPHRNPEQLAFGKYDADRIPLYRVRFDQTHVWDDYAGNPDDTIEVEIYEHWLEPAAPAPSTGDPGDAA